MMSYRFYIKYLAIFCVYNQLMWFVNHVFNGKACVCMQVCVFKDEWVAKFYSSHYLHKFHGPLYIVCFYMSAYLELINFIWT